MIDNKPPINFSQTITIQINEETPSDTAFAIKSYISKILSLKDIKQGAFEFTFCDNETIIEINKKYLNRTYATDIISFNLGDKDNIDGDIYISVDQVKENSVELAVAYEDELKTVIIHGILHLLDYEDYTPEQKDIMFKEQTRLFDLAKDRTND